MYVRVCVCVGQTLLSYARGFPRGPKTYRRLRLRTATRGQATEITRLTEGHKYQMDAERAYTVIPYQLSDEACARAPSPI